ncbi:MAG: BlaI/MecI/CopY family transcriptional regulator [Verrucomicrobiales bacterium]|nr:BlaI/MecI/CopY family transcriptional regulator [Verrucomicrobiales bacterium]
MAKTTSIPGAGDGLTRRERQIMEIIHARGEISARTVHDQLPDPPTYATVRTLLRVLEEKGHLKHHKEGKTFIYTATRSKEAEGESNLKRVVQSFFSGSVAQVMSCLLDEKEDELSVEEIQHLESLIKNAKKRKENESKS